MKYLLLNECGVVVDYTYDRLIACEWFLYGLDVECVNPECYI